MDSTISYMFNYFVIATIIIINNICNRISYYLVIIIINVTNIVLKLFVLLLLLNQVFLTNENNKIIFDYFYYSMRIILIMYMINIFFNILDFNINYTNYNNFTDKILLRIMSYLYYNFSFFGIMTIIFMIFNMICDDTYFINILYTHLKAISLFFWYYVWLPICIIKFYIEIIY
jgi:hypothetical protein